jgi:hypothetical protein
MTSITQANRNVNIVRQAVRFNRTLHQSPCGYEPRSRRFSPTPIITGTSEPVDMIVRMKTLKNGARVMVTQRDKDGRAIRA